MIVTSYIVTRVVESSFQKLRPSWMNLLISQQLAEQAWLLLSIGMIQVSQNIALCTRSRVAALMPRFLAAHVPRQAYNRDNIAVHKVRSS